MAISPQRVIGHPIDFTFGSRVWFSGSADGVGLFPVRQINVGGHGHEIGARLISEGRVAYPGA